MHLYLASDNSYVGTLIFLCIHILVSLVQTDWQNTAIISFTEFDTVSEAFVFLTSQLKLLLDKTDFSNIQRSCIEQMNTPSGAQLSPELIAKVKLCENVTKLFEVLADSVYWS